MSKFSNYRIIGLKKQNVVNRDIGDPFFLINRLFIGQYKGLMMYCLLYTSDAADE